MRGREVALSAVSPLVSSSTPGGRRVAGALLAAALALAVVPAAAGASTGRVVLRAVAPAPPSVATPRIVGGQATTIAGAPYLVRIRAREDGQPYGASGPFSYSTCGGTLVDPTHVVTAAHCVLNAGADVPPASFRVNTGFSRFNATPGSGGDPRPLSGDALQTRTVEAVRRHPGYALRAGGSGTLAELVNDVAVLTLSSPVRTDASTQPIGLADAGASPLGTARTAGYGLQADGGTADGLLYALDTPLSDASTPLASGGTGGLNALYAVSQSPVGSTCQGDSGGPLVQNGRLIGVVSSGPSCGPGAPSFYTNVAAPEVREFLLGNDAPPAAPRGGEDVSLRTPKAPRTGDTLTCSAGTWSNGPTFVHTFTDTRNGRVLQSGPGATYVLAQDTVGATVSCRAAASTAGGTGRTPPTGATAAVAQGPQAKLRARMTASRSRVPRRGRVRMRITVTNTSSILATTVRTCVRPGPRFVVTQNGGGQIVGGRLCWTTPSVKRGVTKRFELKTRKQAKRGRTTLASASVTAPYVKSAGANRRITVRR